MLYLPSEKPHMLCASHLPTRYGIGKSQSNQTSSHRTISFGFIVMTSLSASMQLPSILLMRSSQCSPLARRIYVVTAGGGQVLLQPWGDIWFTNVRLTYWLGRFQNL